MSKVSDQVKRQIIEFVRTQEMIYNSSSPSFKSSKQIKLSVLNNFGQKLNPKINGDQILKIWNQLRNQYTGYRTQYAEKGVPEKTWKFYADLRWLDDHLEPTRKPLSVPQQLEHQKASTENLIDLEVDGVLATASILNSPKNSTFVDLEFDTDKENGSLTNDQSPGLTNLKNPKYQNEKQNSIDEDEDGFGNAKIKKLKREYESTTKKRSDAILDKFTNAITAIASTCPTQPQIAHF